MQAFWVSIIALEVVTRKFCASVTLQVCALTVIRDHLTIQPKNLTNGLEPLYQKQCSQDQ